MIENICPVFVYMMSKVQSCSCTDLQLHLANVHHRAVKRDVR